MNKRYCGRAIVDSSKDIKLNEGDLRTPIKHVITSAYTLKESDYPVPEDPTNRWITTTYELYPSEYPALTTRLGKKFSQESKIKFKNFKKMTEFDSRGISFLDDNTDIFEKPKRHDIITNSKIIPGKKIEEENDGQPNED
jgi:hypothetical protein